MELNIPQEYIVAARLADPTSRCQIDSGRAVEWSAVLNVLIKNKVPLIGLDNDHLLNGCPLVLNLDFKEAVQAERLVLKNLRDEYGELRQALLEEGIQNVLLKSPGLSPSFPYTSDNVDMLVQPEHINLSRQILISMGYVELRNIEEPKKWLFRKFRAGKSISAIHLHEVVGWGVPFLDDSALWKRVCSSIDDPWVLVPFPDDAFLVTIAHAFYENKSFKLLDIARLRHCLHQENLDFTNVKNIAHERGWEDGLAFCLLLYSRLEERLYKEALIPSVVLDWAWSVASANAWLSRMLEKTLKRNEVHFPFRVSFFFGKILYYRKILHDPQRKLITRIYDVVSTFTWGIKLKLHISGQRGFIVSFCGIDGAGKTVHSQSLAKAFATCAINAHIFWSRFGSPLQKDFTLHRMAPKHYSSDIAASLTRRRQRLHNPLVRLGWLIYNLIGYIIRCNLRVRLPQWFGRVVICDRYIYDAIIEIQASLPIGSQWSLWAERLIVLLCPRPDIAWLLDVPADLSVERRVDEKGGIAACEELSNQRSRFKSLITAYGLKVLPTSRGLSETSSQVVRETLLRYYEEYGTWVRALLLSNSNQMNHKKEK